MPHEDRERGTASLISEAKKGDEMAEPKIDLTKTAPDNCPFCGDDVDGEPTYKHQVSGSSVECENCGFTGPLVEGMENAYIEWNKLVRGYKTYRGEGL